MISTTAAHATSLFQYIDDQRSGTQFISDMSKLSNQTSRQDVSDIEQSLVSLNSIDDMVSKITSGDTSVSSAKVKDMMNFYGKQVADELNDTLARYNLMNMPEVQKVDGQWQVPEGTAVDKNLKGFMAYLNGDQRLGKKIEQTIKLSELNEQIAAREQAKSLKQQDVPDADIEAFLIDVSEHLQNHRSFAMENGRLGLGNSGLVADVYKAHFDKSESDAES